jgi:hypothetical protein
MADQKKQSILVGVITPQELMSLNIEKVIKSSKLNDKHISIIDQFSMAYCKKILTTMKDFVYDKNSVVPMNKFWNTINEFELKNICERTLNNEYSLDIDDTLINCDIAERNDQYFDILYVFSTKIKKELLGFGYKTKISICGFNGFFGHNVFDECYNYRKFSVSLCIKDDPMVRRQSIELIIWVSW